MTILEFLSQPIWQRLGLTLVHFLWQGLAVAVLAAIFVRAFRLKHGNSRYLAYFLAFAAMIVCPLVTFRAIDIPIRSFSVEAIEAVYDSPDTATTQSIVLQEVETYAPTISSPPPITESVPLSERLSGWLDVSMPWALVLWMVGVIALSVRLLMGFAGLYRWRHNLQPLPESLAQRVVLLSDGLGMRNFSRVFISPTVLQAMAVGYFKPMVLLPAAMLTQMSPEMLEAVIAHELAHIRRFDLWINLAQRVTETLLFYHPAVWWLSSCLRNERELCCDELAVKATGKPLAYATTLESVSRARFSAKQPILATGLGQDNKPTLSRVRHILGLKPSQRNCPFSLAGVIAVLFLAAIIVPTVLAMTNQSDEETAVQDAVEKRAERVKDLFGLFVEKDCSLSNFPEFVWSDIPVLLELAQSEKKLKRMPSSLVSSYAPTEGREGMVALWLIETLRQKQVAAMRTQQGLNGHMPLRGKPMNAFCIKGNIPVKECEISREIYQEVLKLYQQWWKTVGMKSLGEAATFCPLEFTDIQWYGWQRWEKWSDIEIFKKVSNAGIAGQRMIYEIKYYEEHKEYRPGNKARTIYYALKNPAPEKALFTKEMLKVQTIVLHFYDEMGTNIKNKVVFPSIKASKDLPLQKPGTPSENVNATDQTDKEKRAMRVKELYGMYIRREKLPEEEAYDSPLAEFIQKIYWSDIPTLLQLAESNKVLKDMPMSGISSYIQFEGGRQGMVALWLIDALCKKQIAAMVELQGANGRLTNHGLGLNPICIKGNMPRKECENSLEIHQEVLELYRRWWRAVGTKTPAEAAIFDPLELSDIKWVGRQQWERHLDIEIFKKVTDAGIAGQRIVHELQYHKEAKEFRPGKKVRTINYVLKQSADQKGPFTKEMLKVQKIVLHFYDDKGKHIKDKAVFPSGKASEDLKEPKASDTLNSRSDEEPAVPVAAKEAWGKGFGGLRTAVEFVPQKDSYVLGEPIGVKFHIKNFSSEDAEFSSESVRQDWATVKDSDGKEVMVFRGWHSGSVTTKHHVIKPGQTLTLKTSGLRFGDLRDPAILADKPKGPFVGSNVRCGPGKYTVYYKVNKDLQTGRRKVTVNSQKPADKKTFKLTLNQQSMLQAIESLRRKYRVRICFEQDGSEPAGKQNLLPSTYFGATIPELLDSLTKTGLYKWEKFNHTYVIYPKQNSLLSFYVKTDISNSPLEVVVRKILDQNTKGKQIGIDAIYKGRMRGHLWISKHYALYALSRAAKETGTGDVVWTLTHNRGVVRMSLHRLRDKPKSSDTLNSRSGEKAAGVK